MPNCAECYANIGTVQTTPRSTTRRKPPTRRRSS
jgi:hypothetical protein